MLFFTIDQIDPSYIKKEFFFPSKTCIIMVAHQSYSRLETLLELFQEALKDFPKLTPGSVFAGTFHNDTDLDHFGRAFIQFDIDEDAPESYTRISTKPR